MKHREIPVLTDVALLTCVVERGVGDTIIAAARAAGVTGATVYFAQGAGVRERLGVLGVAIETEKEVVDIVVATDQVDRVFESLFLAAQLDTPGKGIIYVSHLDKAATYIPPAVLAELDRSPS